MWWIILALLVLRKSPAVQAAVGAPVQSQPSALLMMTPPSLSSSGGVMTPADSFGAPGFLGPPDPAPAQSGFGTPRFLGPPEPAPSNTSFLGPPVPAPVSVFDANAGSAVLSLTSGASRLTQQGDPAAAAAGYMF